MRKIAAKKKLVGISTLCAVISTFGQYAMASTGTIEFEGEITAETCYVDIDGSGAAQTGGIAHIRLPTIGAGVLAAAGNTAGTTRFVMKVSQDAGGTKPCEATLGGGTAAKDVYAFFEAGAENDINGRLENLSTVGAAKNVKLQLLNKDGDQVVVGASGSEPWVAQKSTVESMANALSPGLIHYIQYYATGPASAGAVTGKAVFTLAYK